jgi:hypothetical protein
MLIEEARKIPGPRLLIALDADEFLTANFFSDAEWQQALSSPPGTVIGFHWAVVLPDLKSYYLYPCDFPLGFMDNGSPHEGKPIHSPRLPVPKGAPWLSMQRVRVLHYSVAEFERFKSKIRWYQCWELLHQANHRGYLSLYRWYHKDFCVPESERRALPAEWTAGYTKRGIDLHSFAQEAPYRWDKEILKLFSDHGVDKFRRLAVWNVDWRQRYQEIHGNRAPRTIFDPRNWLERGVHGWLERTQRYYSHFEVPQTKLQRVYLRGVQKLLHWCGW